MYILAGVHGGNAVRVQFPGQEAAADKRQGSLSPNTKQIPQIPKNQVPQTSSRILNLNTIVWPCSYSCSP